MRIAIIIPCFRQAEYLPEAIASVRAQTRRGVVPIVVAGDEKSRAVASDLGTSVEYRAARGLADARNAGIQWWAMADDLILPLDADDVLAPNAIERLLAHVPVAKYWIVGSDVQEFGDSTRLWRLPAWSNLREQNAMPYCSLFPRTLWAALGGYTDGPHEDWRFWLEARRLDPRVVQVHEPLLRYRRHPASLTATMDLAAGRAFVHARYPA